MSARPSRGIEQWKDAGVRGGGIVARWRDGSVTYGGQLKSGDWIFMAVTEDRRGAYAVADKSRDAKVVVCDTLGLSKAAVIGGPYTSEGDTSVNTTSRASFRFGSGTFDNAHE
jgi:hypothetical protein